MKTGFKNTVCDPNFGCNVNVFATVILSQGFLQLWFWRQCRGFWGLYGCIAAATVVAFVHNIKDLLTAIFKPGCDKIECS